jgi:hypothetical protein
MVDQVPKFGVHRFYKEPGGCGPETQGWAFQSTSKCRFKTTAQALPGSDKNLLKPGLEPGLKPGVLCLYRGPGGCGRGTTRRSGGTGSRSGPSGCGGPTSRGSTQCGSSAASGCTGSSATSGTRRYVYIPYLKLRLEFAI